jgi:hypothetical protein
MSTGNGDSAAELKKRAETLRSCAKRARTAAKGLHGFLDSEVRKATGSGDRLIWLGPFATDSTDTLLNRQKRLRKMADDLVTDAKRWETAAGHLEDRAKGAAKKGH